MQYVKRDTFIVVDAFAYDSTMPKGELVAIDDVVWPKYAFTYNISESMPQVTLWSEISSVHENWVQIAGGR